MQENSKCIHKSLLRNTHIEFHLPGCITGGLTVTLNFSSAWRWWYERKHSYRPACWCPRGPWTVRLLPTSSMPSGKSSSSLEGNIQSKINTSGYKYLNKYGKKYIFSIRKHIWSARLSHCGSVPQCVTTSSTGYVCCFSLHCKQVHTVDSKDYCMYMRKTITTSPVSKYMMFFYVVKVSWLLKSRHS